MPVQICVRRGGWNPFATGACARRAVCRVDWARPQLTKREKEGLGLERRVTPKQPKDTPEK
eukprot:3825849-Rhodomonas_salina.1